MTQVLDLPADFTTRIRGAFPSGADWLTRLPALIAECERRWSLNLGRHFPELSYNFVAPAVRADGSPAVLKLGVPNRELTSEIEALRFYDGCGAVHLLDADPDLGALLLERLSPGTMLASWPDDAGATAIAAQVMRELWRPAPAEGEFLTVAGWAAGLTRLRTRFAGGSGPFPEKLVATAETLFAELLASSAPPVLLHGDLHHFNILTAQRAPWLAIDPKGVIGEPAYEIGALLRNPWDDLLAWPNLRQIQARRIDQLADLLDLDRARITGWAVAQAVLSAWWDYEDAGDGWRYGLACAEVLRDLLP